MALLAWLEDSDEAPQDDEGDADLVELRAAALAAKCR